ncbi:MAG: hypothetical protein TECD_01049 [Hyphomicrobiaceae bacterium hypho_1]
MKTRTPVTIITGMLGAGKTTLINNLLAKISSEKIAIIINEFGNVGVDGTLLAENKQEDIIELTSGCICCTVMDDLIPIMERLLTQESAPDHIIIETSGLTLPKPLVQALRWPQMRSRVVLNGVIVIVDVFTILDLLDAKEAAFFETRKQIKGSFKHYSSLYKIFKDQLSCADLIVLNKHELLLDSSIENIDQLIKSEKKPGVQLIKSVHGNIPSELIMSNSIGVKNNIGVNHMDHNHDTHAHDEFKSVSVNIPSAINQQVVERVVAEVVKDYGILRVKGFAVIEGKSMRLIVQAVGPRVQTYFDCHWTDLEQKKGYLVLIGQKGLDRGAIASALHKALR